MVIRVLFLLLSLFVLANLCILTACYITEQNLYQKYGKQMLTIFGVFVLAVAVVYTAIAIFALK